MKKFLLLFIFAAYITPSTEACVTFVLKNSSSLIFGWNYEFDAGSGYIITNKSGQLKTSFLPQKDIPITWISKYGSLTFNQWGKEFPSGGINETGLVVVQTMFIKTRYPDPDNRSSISELQWIQFQLDNFSTIQEVINSDKELRITNNSIPLHYMICDRTGNVAVLEFINGRMISYVGKDLTCPVLANDSYKESLIELQKYKGFGGNSEIPKTSTGPKSGNFIIASDNVKKYNYPDDVINYSFLTLSISSEPKRTQWSVVFDVNNMDIYFKSLDNRNLKKLSLKNFDFSCVSATQILDISCDIPVKFIPYSFSIDFDYINKAYYNPAIPWIKEVVPEKANSEKKDFITTIKCK